MIRPGRITVNGRSHPTAPLAIDLFCGLGGWAEGFLAEGYRVIGFDNGECGRGLLQSYPGEFVIQDILTLHGRQFRNATVIVASPPCQAYSYRAMPWSRAKALPPPDNTLFDACFRIQREASEAAGRKIPLIVENVRGAQKWVGRAKWHYGSYYLWGDVPALMPMTQRSNYEGGNWCNGNQSPASHPSKFFKSRGMNWNNRELRGQDFTRVAGRQSAEGIKIPGNNGPIKWADRDIQRLKDLPTPFTAAGESKGRKLASALIAKIPFPLARHIASVFKPENNGEK